MKPGWYLRNIVIGSYNLLLIVIVLISLNQSLKFFTWILLIIFVEICTLFGLVIHCLYYSFCFEFFHFFVHWCYCLLSYFKYYLFYYPFFYVILPIFSICIIYNVDSFVFSFSLFLFVWHIPFIQLEFFQVFI